jgi:hypothetical protein
MTDFVGSHAARLGAPRGLRSPRPRAPAFRWSWKLVTVAGIDVYVHGTFLLLIALMAFGDLVAGQGIAVVVRSTFSHPRGVHQRGASRVRPRAHGAALRRAHPGHHASADRRRRATGEVAGQAGPAASRGVRGPRREPRHRPDDTRPAVYVQ